MQSQALNGLSDQLVFVNLDITCWSGKKTLTPEDLGLDRSQLPPETLVSLGEKQLIDPEALRTFTSIRSAARRLCLAVGTRFLGGHAVPAAKAPALLAELDALGQRYRDARATFLAGYDDATGRLDSATAAGMAKADPGRAGPGGVRRRPTELRRPGRALRRAGPGGGDPRRAEPGPDAASAIRCSTKWGNWRGKPWSGRFRARPPSPGGRSVRWRRSATSWTG